MTMLGLASIQIALRQIPPSNLSYDTLPLVIMVPGISLLSALSHDSKKERRELALLAYGSRNWQIYSRYFLRGSILTSVGILPIIIVSLLAGTGLFTAFLVSGLVISAGTLYCLPSLHRVSSLDFVGRYKR
jgi:hypothetical protein